MQGAQERQHQKILVYDPGFVQRCGHHYTYNSLLRDAFARSGVEACFLTGSVLPDDVAGEFGAIARPLRVLFYEEPTGEQAMERLSRRALAFAADLVEFAGEAEDGHTLLFAHTLDPSALLGVALWHDALPPDRRPRLALNVMLGADGEREYRELLAPALRPFAGYERVSLFGGTPALARLLSGMTGKSCQVLPTPLPENGFRRKAGPPGEMAYGLIGDARKEKNLDILPQALERYLGQGGQGTFAVAVTPTDARLMEPLVALHELGRQFPERVRVEYRHLAVEEYYGRMAASTALIVPYSYGRFRPSGLVIEAAAMGTPVIGLEGGFAEDELGALDNGSLFMPRATPALLSRALLRFDKEYVERGAKARVAARVYAERQGMSALLRCLGLVESVS